MHGSLPTLRVAKRPWMHGLGAALIGVPAVRVWAGFALGVPTPQPRENVMVLVGMGGDGIGDGSGN